MDTARVNIVTGKTADGHTYALCYVDSERANALRTIGRWASDPRLDFSWYDAGGMGASIRNLEMRREKGHVS
jgi:hypothetical protein